MMTHETLVSIITPCYNHERFIAQCIESVTAQTYSNWEMILVDDRSRDRSLEIIEGYARQDPRIKVICHNLNYGAGGLVTTYNEALNVASGELVAILEGDDFWLPGKLEAQVPAFRDKNVILVYSDFDEISESGELINSHHLRIDPSRLRTCPPRNLEYFSHLRSLGANTVVVRKAALIEVGGFVASDIPTVDFPTWLRLSLEGDFVCIPKTLACWHRHKSSISFNHAEDVAEGVAKLFDRFLRNNYQRVKRHALEVETLRHNAEKALWWQRNTAAYFEGKYRLIFGDNKAARKWFIRALTSVRTPLRYKVAASLGLAASLISKQPFLAVLNLRRRLLSEG